MTWIEFRVFVDLDGEKMTSPFSLPSNYSLAFLSGTRHWYPQQRALPVTLFPEEITDLCRSRQSGYRLLNISFILDLLLDLVNA